MAKKIKFPLELKDKVQVRTLEQLRENFDMEMIITYFLEGKLKIWLEDRYYEEEAEKISKLNPASLSFKKQLCEALGVEYIDIDININEIKARNERISKLLQYTDDEEVINKIDNVVFDQEELSDILDEGINLVYLCSENYTIPNSKKNITYVGIGNPTVRISSIVDVDFDAKKIIFNNLTLTSMNKIKVKADDSKGIKYEGSIITQSVEKKTEEHKLPWQVYIGNDDALYKSREDGSEETLLSEEDHMLVDYCVYKDFLCYMVYNKEFKIIYRINLNDDTSKKEITRFEIDSVDSRGSKTLFCNDKWIVWLERGSYAMTKIMRCNVNGEAVRQIQYQKDWTSTLELLGDYLFYVKENSGGELIRVSLVNFKAITIDYHVSLFCTNNMNKLFYCRYYPTELGTKTLASIQEGNGEYIYECNLDGSDKKLLGKYRKLYMSIKKLEYTDQSLYYETGEYFCGSTEKYKINLE